MWLRSTGVTWTACSILRLGSVFLLAAVTLMAQETAAPARRAPELTPEMKARLEKAPKPVEMFQPMRDSVVLAANVYLPPGAGPFPTVLLRTPYIKDNAREPLAAEKYVEAGYAYVDQDV